MGGLVNGGWWYDGPIKDVFLSLNPSVVWFVVTPQDQVNPHELSRRLEEVLVDAVNDVGVDLNKAVSASPCLNDCRPPCLRPLHISIYTTHPSHLHNPPQLKQVSTMHQAALLPFVAGLGFRKANALRAAVRAQAGGAVLSRQQLLEEGFLTPKVG